MNPYNENENKIIEEGREETNSQAGQTQQTASQTASAPQTGGQPGLAVQVPAACGGDRREQGNAQHKGSEGGNDSFHKWFLPVLER